MPQCLLGQGCMSTACRRTTPRSGVIQRRRRTYSRSDALPRRLIHDSMYQYRPCHASTTSPRDSVARVPKERRVLAPMWHAHEYPLTLMNEKRQELPLRLHLHPGHSANTTYVVVLHAAGTHGYRRTLARRSRNKGSTLPSHPSIHSRNTTLSYMYVASAVRLKTAMTP